MSLKIFSMFKKPDPEDSGEKKSPADIVEESMHRDHSLNPIEAITNALLDYEKLPLLTNLTQDQINGYSLMMVKNQFFYGNSPAVAAYQVAIMAYQVSYLGSGRDGLERIAQMGQIVEMKKRKFAGEK